MLSSKVKAVPIDFDVASLLGAQSNETTCPFCQLTPTDFVAENAFHSVIRDRFPVSLGDSLLIPKRHVASLFAFRLEPA